MRNVSLQDLLLHADGAAPPPVLAGDLAGRVRRTALRRARVRSAVFASSVVAACGLLIALLIPRRPAEPVAGLTPGQVIQIRRELVRLDSAAAMHQRTADELRRFADRSAREREQGELLARLGPIERLSEARDRTAMMIVRQAEREKDEIDVTEAYRRAARLFPETPAGRLATERLKTQTSPT